MPKHIGLYSKLTIFHTYDYGRIKSWLGIYSRNLYFGVHSLKGKVVYNVIYNQQFEEFEKVTYNDI